MSFGCLLIGMSLQEFAVFTSTFRVRALWVQGRMVALIRPWVIILKCVLIFFMMDDHLAVCHEIELVLHI